MTEKQTTQEQPPSRTIARYQAFLPVTLVALINVIALAALLVLLVAYRTEWGKTTLNPNLLPGLGGFCLIGFLVLFRLIYAMGRQTTVLKNIRSNLETLCESEETEHPYELLQGLNPLPATTQPDPMTLGWNRLIEVIDRASQEGTFNQSDQNLNQVFSSYESQRLAKLFDALGNGIILADITGSVVQVNRACEGMLGRSLSQMMGHSILALFDDPDAKAVFQNLLDKQVSGNTQLFEITRQAESARQPGKSTNPDDDDQNPKDSLLGSEKSIFQISCQRINSNDVNSDILIVIRDVTQQKISEASQTDFVAHVSHELRSPLANIRAYSETLLSDMELDAKTQKEAFNVINDETVRLTRMINEVLDLSQMEAGSMRLDKSEVITDRLIRQCINDLKAMAASKNITLQTNFHPKLPNLYADRDKLAVVFNNILSNAIKYTPDGGTVFFETNVDEEFVYAKITDTGYGIGPADMDKIFDKFYRVDREETANIPGTGLGLATSKEIVTQHGGAIDVTSELNKGTEMLVKLPLSSVGPVLGPAIKNQ